MTKMRIDTYKKIAHKSQLILYKSEQKRIREKEFKVDLVKGNVGIDKKSKPKNLEKNEAEEANEYGEEKVIDEDKEFG